MTVDVNCPELINRVVVCVHALDIYKVHFIIFIFRICLIYYANVKECIQNSCMTVFNILLFSDIMTYYDRYCFFLLFISPFFALHASFCSCFLFSMFSDFTCCLYVCYDPFLISKCICFIQLSKIPIIPN